MDYNEEEVNELFDVVFKLSAKDINDKLTKVRNRPEIAKRRWFWELLQNAKDSVKATEHVSVLLKLAIDENGQPCMTFSHNGNPFRYQDAKNLIFPYSDKDEADEDSDKSGRFGTGFLATHVLSKTINVQGVFIKNSSAYDFNFTLDRSHEGKTAIAESINTTWQSFRKNSLEKPGYRYNQSNFETQFKYPLDAGSIELVKESIQDFENSLPYALTFIPKVKHVSIVNEIDNYEVKVTNNIEKKRDLNTELKEYFVEKETINKGAISITHNHLIIASDKMVDVGLEIEEKNGKIEIKELNENQPILFCPFPLIGANSFPFPVVINSTMFAPKEERDGVWLADSPEGKSNQDLFENVIQLYKALVKFAGDLKWRNTHLLFKTLKDTNYSVADFDKDWYSSNIQKPLKEFLISSSLLDNSLNERIPIYDGKTKVLFPSNSKPEVREQIWDLLDVIVPQRITAREEIHNWFEVLWDDISKTNLKSLAQFVTKRKTVDELSKAFGSNSEKALQWLNSLISLISKEQESILSESEIMILPNQHGEFRHKDALYLDDGSISKELKDILFDISKLTPEANDWRYELLDTSIFLELQGNRTRTIQMIGTIISDHIKTLLKTEFPSNELKNMYSRMLIWMNDHPLEAKEYFKGLRTDSLLYQSTDRNTLKSVTELLQKDRDGEISVVDLVKIDSKKIALLEDPELELKIRLGESVMAEQKREQEEFEFKKKTGDIFESVFQKIINQDAQLIISKVEGEEDFIIRNPINNRQFYIELKSTKNSQKHITITHKQAKKAKNNPGTYFLCMIPNSGEEITEEYFKTNARFDSQIGNKLAEKVEQALAFETESDGLKVEFEDALLSTYKKHRYKFLVQKYLVGQDSFELFTKRLSEK